MYVTEAMMGTLTEANNNAANFTRQIKLMLETDARMHGLELDRRNSPWDMFNELQEHLATIAPDTILEQQQHMPPAPMDTAPIDAEPMMDTAPIDTPIPTTTNPDVIVHTEGPLAP